jgi:hypothetical protein
MRMVIGRTNMQLTVPLADAYLDAGEVVVGSDGELIIRPPQPTLFRQIVRWLYTQPEPPWLGLPNYLLGVGATALCVRWGSYLAVLMDANKPIDPRTKHPHISMVGNNEMMRVNIEVSANLEHLLHLLQSDEHEFYRLLERAYAYLPMPQKRVKRDFQLAAAILTIAEFFNEHPAELNLNPTYTDLLLTHPFRVVANLITLWAYRNGEVENVHAGEYDGYSLAHRRFTLAQEKQIVGVAASQLSGVLTAHTLWSGKFPGIGQWPGNVVGLTRGFPYYYPTDWSLTDTSSEVKLPKGDVQLPE